MWIIKSILWFISGKNPTFFCKLMWTVIMVYACYTSVKTRFSSLFMIQKLYSILRGKLWHLIGILLTYLRGDFVLSINDLRCMTWTMSTLRRKIDSDSSEGKTINTCIPTNYYVVYPYHCHMISRSFYLCDVRSESNE